MEIKIDEGNENRVITLKPKTEDTKIEDFTLFLFFTKTD